MLFREEILDDDLIAEIEELLVSQQEEVCKKDRVYDVDWAKYLTLNKILRVYTVRENKKLVGYSSFIISKNVHYQNDLFAANDAIYILPDYRKDGTGRDFIAFCGGRLAEENINVVTIAVKPKRDFSKMLIEIGYELEETTYLKRL